MWDSEAKRAFVCPTLVYQDQSLGDSDSMGTWEHAAVHVHDLSTHEDTPITSGEWIAAYPDIFGDVVVWADYRDCTDPNNKNSLSNVEIWGYNLSTGIAAQITDLPGRSKTTPRIWEDKVFVHMHFEGGGGNGIYMFDLPATLLPSKTVTQDHQQPSGIGEQSSS